MSGDTHAHSITNRDDDFCRLVHGGPYWLDTPTKWYEAKSRGWLHACFDSSCGWLHLGRCAPVLLTRQPFIFGQGSISVGMLSRSRSSRGSDAPAAFSPFCLPSVSQRPPRGPGSRSEIRKHLPQFARLWSLLNGSSIGTCSARLTTRLRLH